MEVTDQSLRLLLIVCAVVVAVSAVASTLILAGLRGDLFRALRPSLKERLARLEAQTLANDRLIESYEGRTALVEFFASEMHISAFFREAEDEIERAKSIDEVRAVLEQMKSEEKKKWRFNLDSLKRGAKYLGDKLVDKANDFVKPYLGGGNDRENA